MSDLRKRQENFRDEHAFGIHSHVAFDAFRDSPEYFAMREALEFYAKGKHWQIVAGYGEQLTDKGSMARDVLAAIEGGNHD